ncbi:MAG: hypothetical protein V3W41_10685 [Planctomycetota bacterium]
MLRCPDQPTLYSYLDGEVSPDLFHLLDVHARSCNSCRQRLEDLSRVQGLLFERPRTIEPVHFNDKFKERLLHRLSTGDEIRRSIRRSRYYRMGPSATAAAAVVFLALGALIYSLWVDPVLNPGHHSSSSSFGRGTVALADADEPGAAGFAELKAALWPNRSVLSLKAATEFEGYKRLFSGSRMAMMTMIAHLLDAHSPGLRQAAVQLLGRRSERSSSECLRRFFERDELAQDERNEALLAYVGRRGLKNVSAVLQELERGYAPDEAAVILRKLETPRGWRALRKLAKKSRGDSLRDVLSIVADSSRHEADDLLRQAYLEGSQSQFLIEFLSKRNSTAPWARALLRGRRGSGKEIQGLIRLLGSLRDEKSIELIVRRLDQNLLFDECVKALARIGSPGALDVLVNRIDMGPKRSPDLADDRMAGVLKGILSLRGGRDVDLFLSRATAERGLKGRRYLVAAGWAGGGIHIPALEKLAERDRYEAVAVEAIAQIGEHRSEDRELSREALVRLSENRDPSLRKTARRRLRRDHRKR